MRKNLARGLAVGGVLFLALSACDLDVVNEQQPDRTRAVGDPESLEALLGGAFTVLFNTLHNTAHVVNMYPNFATEFTGIPLGGGSETVVEPRLPYTNTPSVSADGPRGPRFLWAGLSTAASNAHDGLRTIEELNLTIRSGGVDVTPRARAFGKFVQGWAWGYQALAFDQVVVIHEDTALRSDIIDQTIESIVPWTVALDAAMEAFDEAIAIAQQHQVTFPSFGSSRLYFATNEPIGTADFVRLVNTLKARMLVLSARSPADRRNVDWSRVLQFTENGVVTDFEPVLASGFRQSLFFQRAQDNAGGCTNCYRWDMRLLGQSDTSGRFQDWIAAPIDERNRFDILTPDRRITGPTPTSNGSYTRYVANDNGFPEGRGLYFRSGYQWARHAFRGFLANSGTAIMASADENRLLRAEALIRTGDLEGAAALINTTRTRPQSIEGTTYPGLPAVTAAGVPPGSDCVPRTDTGACGDLMVALRYERMIELAGIDSVRGYLDSRGFGLLPDFSWEQAPIPGNELELLGLPIYTFGGVGGTFSAQYSPVTLGDL